MPVKFTNNASTTLAAAITNVATTLTVAAGKGALFPTLASDYFYCVLTNAGATLFEVIQVTARAGDVFTMGRGQDSTTALAWALGDIVELRIVAANVTAFPVTDQVNTFTANNIFSSTGAITVCNGTTAQRPTAVLGMMRYNNTTSAFEGYGGASPAWGALAAGGGGGGGYTGPAFSAYQSTLQAILTGTITRIQLQTEDFDTANAFDSATNYRFQPVTSGYYQLTGSIGWDPAAPPAGSAATIYKNGVEYKRGMQLVGGSYANQVGALVFLNGSTDYAELWAFQNSGATVNTLNISTKSFFHGVQVR